ncbi:uncharacterized protein K460DRAFT_369051 [Cucurbitaria berberidis CBS 394.84]|uniref:RBR-type E3 ubiquitin transferase n=1 Tax=Cucurbitaria berberidis CBS 394.84 TaxID=1168544 RepID=A0A9P4GF18_9PLEO|nr:uncharacterized protein K460DRAFT_369051 [Cucurbitaria berberidis CBS 394.84]KAF1844182.1 hypothetical protein K460DRAFT_369051 [Cucurbitaria berberidis CBS 394.84]
MARAPGTARIVQRHPQRALQAAGVTPPSSSNTRVLRSNTAKAAAPVSKVTKRKTRRRRADPWTPKRKVNPNPTSKPRAPPQTHFTCRICIEEQTTDQFIPPFSPRRQWSLPMDSFDVPYHCIAHLSRNPRKKSIKPVCKSCIGNNMAARLDMLGARKVGAGCLEPGCEEPWSHSFIMRYLPRGEPLEKFNMEMFNVWLEDVIPKPMTCLSPTCTAVGLPDVMSAGYPEVTCHECLFRSCALCLVPWHKDVTCAELSAKRINEQMSDPEKDTLKLMQTKDGKRCPNCHLVIEKDGGCDSMHCIGCNKYFNWSTAASAVPGAKKAESVQHVSHVYQNGGPVICEMDSILETAAAPAVVAAAS